MPSESKLLHVRATVATTKTDTILWSVPHDTTARAFAVDRTSVTYVRHTRRRQPSTRASANSGAARIRTITWLPRLAIPGSAASAPSHGSLASPSLAPLRPHHHMAPSPRHLWLRCVRTITWLPR